MKMHFYILLVLLMLSGCANTQTLPPATPSSPAPTESTLSSAARSGELVFLNGGCAGCHSTGTDLKVGPGLAGFMAGRGSNGNMLPNGQPLTDPNLMQWIRDGNSMSGGLMPGNPALSEQNLRDLLAYLRTLE